MSNYSTELRYIIQSGYDLGLKDYEILSEEYRERLNKKIIDHFYFHEIGFETASRFKHYLNSTMNEIMPYYNQLLQSELLEINPLLTFERKINSTKGVDTTLTEDIDNLTTKIGEVIGTQSLASSTDLTSDTTDTKSETQNKDGTSTQIGTNTKEKTRANTNNMSEADTFYDTPSGSLGDIETSNYATNVTKKAGENTLSETDNETISDNITNTELVENVVTGTDTSSVISGSTSSSSSNSKDDVNESVTGSTDISKVSNLNEINVITENGFEIPLSDLLIKYRDTFLNIDLMVINNLKDLFMMIY